MKYYLYISDAKVDMLLPQVPHKAKKKTSTELGFDLKVLSAKYKSEAETDFDRISRLETVVDFIREYGNIGTLDEPDDFIEDFATVGVARSGQSTTKVAYFGGKTERTVFALVGSAVHLVSGTKTTAELAYHSEIGEIIGWLQETVPANRGRFNLLRSISFLVPLSTWGDCSYRIEFMAKRLHSELVRNAKGENINVVLATPLYIAMADSEHGFAAERG